VSGEEAEEEVEEILGLINGGENGRVESRSCIALKKSLKSCSEPLGYA
jgi:hypothetical protein